MAGFLAKPPFPTINLGHPLAYGLVGTWTFYEGAGGNLYDLSNRGNHGTWNGTKTPGTINSGLVGYWALDESSGTTMNDFSGKGYNGTYTGTTTDTSIPSAIKFNDPAGRAFNGSNGSAAVPSNADLQTGSKSFTCTFWIKTSAAAQGQPIGKGSWVGDDEWVLQMTAAGIAQFTTVKDSTHFQTASWGSAINNGAWRFVVLTQDTGVNNRIGISVDNGAFVYTTINQPSVSSAEALTFGAAPELGHFYACSLDDVRFYNRVLTATEITALATGFYGIGAATSYYAGGALGYAGIFDGTDNYVSVANNPSLNFTGGLTIACMVNPLSLSNNPIMVDKAFTTSYYLQLISGGKIEFGGSTGVNSHLQGTSTTVKANSWNFVVGTYDTVAGVINLYNNGALVDTASGKSGGIGTNANNLTLASISAHNGNFFGGLIDSIFIYNRSLSGQEVSSLYFDPYQMFRL